ncbi:MAG: PQQ-dependent sugar dehydrogenase, partial [Actinobacteria bacterium]|nr:PQQ-dependent sugar dehydrogenase [Actinomycetota bacterium]
PGPILRVWTGPRSATLANGGHLALAPDGRLVIGVGDLQDPARVRDPGAPNGKLLALRPDGPNARPAVLSTGWNNPFAFTFTPDGRLWVADNSPGRRPERLARGDTGGPAAQVTLLSRKTAPSGLAAISSTELAVCGFTSGTLDRYRMQRGRWRFAGAIARGCRYGVVRLPHGRLAFSTGRDIRVVSASSRPARVSAR